MRAKANRKRSIAMRKARQKAFHERLVQTGYVTEGSPRNHCLQGHPCALERDHRATLGYSLFCAVCKAFLSDMQATGTG